jgi:hypothetical protein
MVREPGVRTSARDVADQDRPLGLARAVVDDRVRGDDTLALVTFHDRRRRRRREPVLHRALLGRRDGARFRRVDAEHVLGHVHAHAAHQAERPRVGTEDVGHRRDGVRHVVAAGSTVVREPTGHRDRPLVVLGDAQRVTGEVQRAPEAAVQVEVRDVACADAGDPERLGARGLHGR